MLFLRQIKILAGRLEKQDPVFITRQIVKGFLLFGLIYFNAFADSAKETGEISDRNGSIPGISAINSSRTDRPSVPSQNGHSHVSMELTSQVEDLDREVPGWSKRRGFPTKLINSVYDVIDDLFFKTENVNEIRKEKAKTLQIELEERILSYDLDMPQTIDFLREKNFRKERRWIYKRD